MTGESPEELQQAAILAKLAAAGCNAYTTADLTLMSPRPSHYTEVHVVEKYAPPPRFSGGISLRFYRVMLRQVALDYTNAQWERGKATTALEGGYVTVAGVESSLITRAASDDPIGPDDGWWSGISEFSYGIAS